MLFTQHYLDCLSQASYVIGDETTKKALIIDPRRDTDDYLNEATENGMNIIGVINTHFRADFVSGHLELAEKTGAWIGYGEKATPDFTYRPLTHGERISLGEVTHEILATPGHTPESISVLVYEHTDDNVPYGVLTGDALFIGDVGRPDLLASSGTTAEELGRNLYHSIQHTLMSLPDEVRVFPGHGAGSACGKNLSTEKQSTIGEQRRTNYACTPMSEQEFVDIVTAGQPAPPAYFAYDATLNKKHRPTLSNTTTPALNNTELAHALNNGAIILDTRTTEEFTTAHLRGSINVPFDGRTAETVGMLLKPEQRIILITPEGLEQETTMRLGRIGYDHVLGYFPHLDSHLSEHPEEAEQATRLEVHELDNAAPHTQLLDVRGPGEAAEGAIPDTINIPLPQLTQRLNELDKNRPVIVSCAGGWRSNVAASYLRHQGFTHVADLIGGYNAWADAHSTAH
ncbi:Probable polyketide biosynthesis zinc-dependent hydrolase BaeB [Dermatophilus congolensis]|uniref:Probable polyketide biosynthesis zinc-dependent hydrolase BaeB n=1 Tax=Dermatophilus congolensis TaxID=1863 RepID=A0AA46BMP3_9MICO|nr:MBL fold metallo-hydrolase [Dermatophilus congolensis]STD07700.1 Probable polyketide biosynthesis zinc-dependent hydrolase BaeB [Dermatophilus congolensis]